MSAQKDFAKIVTASDGRPVLFYLDPNGGDYILHQIANYEGCQGDMALEFCGEDQDKNERLARAAFEAVGQEAADKQIGVIKRFIEGPSP